MFTRSRVTAAVCFSFCAHSAGGQTLPQIEEVLTRIQANLAAFQSVVPDLVADERVFSKKIVDGTVKSQTVTDSVFTCVRNFREDREGFIESREVTAVNGKPAAGKKLKGPLVFRGAFVGLVRETFIAGNDKHHNYTLAGTEPVGDSNAFAIAFETKPGQTALGFKLNGRFHITHGAGKAWVDRETFQIVKIERAYSNLPADNEIVLRVEYAPVNVDGRTLLLPRTVYGSDRKVKSKKDTFYEFTAEYRNYRKFSVSSEINYSAK